MFSRSRIASTSASTCQSAMVMVVHNSLPLLNLEVNCRITSYHKVLLCYSLLLYCHWLPVSYNELLHSSILPVIPVYCPHYSIGTVLTTWVPPSTALALVDHHSQQGRRSRYLLISPWRQRNNQQLSLLSSSKAFSFTYTHLLLRLPTSSECACRRVGIESRSDVHCYTRNQDEDNYHTNNPTSDISTDRLPNTKQRQNSTTSPETWVETDSIHRTGKTFGYNDRGASWPRGKLTRDGIWWRGGRRWNVSGEAKPNAPTCSQVLLTETRS